MTKREMEIKLNESLNNVGSVLVAAAKEIVAEMKSRNEFAKDPEKGKFIFSNKRCGFSKGRNIKNDYRNYVWIAVEDANDNEKRWMLALFFNDIDGNNVPSRNSGNPHTQFGRIQFWKDITRKGKVCSSPHELMKEGMPHIKLKFCVEKSHDPGQSICNGTYDCIRLVDDFIRFINGDFKKEKFRRY